MPSATSMDSRGSTAFQNALADAARLALNGGTLKLYALGTNTVRPSDGNSNLTGYTLLSTHTVSCGTAAVAGQFTMIFGAATPSAGTIAFAVLSSSGGVRQLDLSVGTTTLFNVQVSTVTPDGATSITPTALVFAMPDMAF